MENLQANVQQPIQLTREVLELFRRSYAKDATDDELRLHFDNCRRHGVHPMDNLVHFSIRKDKKTGARRYVPIYSIDLYRARADATGVYAGNDEPVFEGDPDSAYPSRAIATVYKFVNGERVAFSASARWDEFFPGDTPEGWMWKQMPYHMLGKCAEVLAMKKCFPAKLASLDTVATVEEDRLVSGQKAKPVPAGRTQKQLPGKHPGDYPTPFSKTKKGAPISMLTEGEIRDGIAYCEKNSVHPDWVTNAESFLAACEAMQDDYRARLFTAATFEEVRALVEEITKHVVERTLTQGHADTLFALADQEASDLKEDTDNATNHG